jgi:enoyl-CoA hydratase
MSGVQIERDPAGIFTIILDRPEAMNALSRALLAELASMIGSLEQDGSARVLIVIGAGDRAFSAGADLKEREQMTPDEAMETIRRIRDTITSLAALPFPTIAAINGAAFGGGTELALACDFRIASSTATLGLTETSLGIIPGGGGTQRLARLIGPGRAKELIFTARRIDAGEALRYGLVEEVVAPEEVRGRARDIAARIAENAPLAVRAAKEAVRRGSEIPLAEALLLETELYERIIETKDRLEGLAAFREKRKPVYRGE